ncbi:TetR family transcriptional regulator [Streptomyces sp. SID486]|uniref:TetR/AcrR family transcriptional regulator n=1 Tax=unclassified Streptomyces TaxID=2593676 RepID=UPI0013716BFC|nr:TetR/AcrR family transcriptional regulator [Streptomyces sp. SID486]MYW19769.1 TetR family transcriptional regulator [Streptomyces sp. SID2955]MYX96783.1 TetR family transcriptional regulator [Streptomyces sp. SID486]
MTESDTSLRDRLVDAGVELLAAEGPQALTLREIARRAGVSHGAPRRYFPTHLELLSAIARRGFADLAGLARAALERETGGPRARVAALARTYLEFALDRPGMYELMFRHDLLESGRLGLRDTSLPLFSLLAGLVGEALPGVDARRAAGALWANLHGTAQLWRWRSLQLATGEEDLAPLLDTVLAAHLGPGEGR